MKLPWFKRMGLLFVPSSLTGWLILTAGICYAVYTFIDIDSRSHSVNDTLIDFVLRLLLIGVFYTLIAFLASRTKKK